MPNKRLRARNRARWQRQRHSDYRTTPLRLDGKGFAITSSHKIKMPRKLKKKMHKYVEALESIYSCLAQQNMQIEKAQRPDVNPLMAIQHKALRDEMMTGESLIMMSRDDTASHIAMDAVRMARTAEHIIITPISKDVPIPQDIKEWAKDYKDANGYDAFIKETTNDICAALMVYPPCTPFAIEKEGGIDDELKIKITGCQRVPKVSDGIRIIMRDEVDKKNDKG